MSSTPGHHNECRVIGDVVAFCRGSDGRTSGVLLRVDTGEPAVIPILCNTLPRVQKGSRIFVRGRLSSERQPGQAYPLVGIVASLVEVLRPRAATA